MKKMGFVILHYGAIEDTFKCISSIINNLEDYLYHIVVVDNCSPDGSGDVLEKKYKNIDSIHIIKNQENLGFSGGNNVGFIYLKENIKCNFIILLNNDVYFTQKNFYTIIEKEYEASQFAVMGPKILLKNNLVNPIYKKLPQKKDLVKIRIKLWMHLVLSYLNLENLYRMIKSQEEDNYDKKETNDYFKDVILHGCCLIFSLEYINKFNGLDAKTFLFGEEELLFLRLKNNNLHSVYQPELVIFHSEDKSTNVFTKTKRKKNIFLYKNLLKANHVLIKEINDNEVRKEK